MSYKDKPIVKLYAYESNAFTLKAIIDDYQEVSVTHSKYEAGEFTLQINYNIPNASFFEAGRFILINDVCCVIQSVTDSISEDGKGSQTRIVSGYDARILYKRRIIKSLNNGNTWTLTGKGETVMRALINAQCGSGVETKRQLPISMSTATTLGSDYTVSEAYTNLYDVLVTIATQTGIGWKVVFENGGLVLKFYQGTDKSATVKFTTEYDSLRSGEFSDSLESFSNAVYVGGKGSNDDKDLYLGEQDIGGSAPSGLERFESYSDAPSMTSDEEYEAEANSILNEYGQTVTISGQGMVQCPYDFQGEYDLGDTIKIGFSGKFASVEVLTLTESWSDGYNIDFSFGKPEPSLKKQLFSILNKISTTSAETSSSSYDSVKYYTLPGATSLPKADVNYSKIGFTGTLSSNQNFTLYFDSSSKVGAKTYHLYFKELTGSGKLTLTTGVTGKTTMQFNTGTYVAIVYVDSEGNIRTGIGTDDESVSTSTTWSSEKTQEEIEAQVDDTSTSSSKTWSSSKIENSIKGFHNRYTSINDLNAKKGTSITLVAGTDNTQKIIDALDEGEVFTDYFANASQYSRFGLSSTFGNTIFLCIEKSSNNYAKITAKSCTSDKFATRYHDSTTLSDWSQLLTINQSYSNLTDCNTAPDGIYSYHDVANAPNNTSDWIMLHTFSFDDSSVYKYQMCFCISNATIFTRVLVNGTWGSWVSK